ncbi:rod shape-determining protein MreC [Mucilaginibacter sp. X5P1]|uniref:rod shape-determining protein MreC n=1 Tax=Mucilaginibacter sp. X5P1 TaxID=2723088 RepID=UPI00160907AA|nr:rod shape-determining protein MreC [Mucilaginibacter sp. X5P1]MBB6141908.1 rod shape-determining protein MreC [Mucilaginibacter sp. X5P1]
MRNLLIFITKYNAFFLFLIFEISALIIYVKYNAFQKASFINSSNEVTGKLYTQVNGLYEYMSLKAVNDSLAHENANLRNQLKSSFYIDTIAKHKIADTVFKIQYEYTPAKVINNSFNRAYNYITINRGSLDGIAVGMGVISSAGIVGKVVNVTPHMANVQSMLNKYSRFSVMLANNKEIGSIQWTDDLDPHKAVLVDVSTNAQPKIGEAVLTSGYSLFPEGIIVGRVSNLRAKGGGMEITLAVDFSKLQYVNVVDNKFQKEQDAIEALQKKDDQDNTR